MGVALVSALAVTMVLGVGSAGATTLSSEGPVVVSGVPLDELNIQTSFSTMACGESDLVGDLEGASEELDVSATDTSCKAFAEAPLKMNGCGLTMHFGPEKPGGGFGGSFDIGPPGCGPISYSSPYCTVTIGAQTGLKASYQNAGGSVVFRAEGSGLKYTQKAGAACSSGSFSNGAFLGEWELTASGGLTLEDSHEPRFETEDYPATVSGNQLAEQPVTFGFEKGTLEKSITATCASATATGLAEGASTELVLTPGFSGCKFANVSGSVNTNGCTYTAHAENPISPFETYEGSLDLSCPAGKGLEFGFSTAFGGCQVSIPSQSDLGNVELANVSGPIDKVEVSMSISGMTYTKVKDTGICPLLGTGSKTDGSLSGSMTLEGSDAESEPLNLYVWGAA